MIANDANIRATMTIQVHGELPIKPPKYIFIPKKLAIRVGGMSISDTRVKTFMILFWSRLMIPITVF